MHQNRFVGWGFAPDLLWRRKEEKREKGKGGKGGELFHFSERFNASECIDNFYGAIT